MKLPSVEELRARIEGRSDAELMRMVSVEASDYRDDVLEIALDELRRRGKERPTPEEFLSTRTPEELREGDLFCRKCLEETTDDGFGTVPLGRLLKGKRKCPTCGSVVRDYYVEIFWLPLLYVASYRVKQQRVPELAEPQIRSIRRLRQKP